MQPKHKKLDLAEIAGEPQAKTDELEELLLFAWLCTNSQDDVAHPIRFESGIKFDA